MKVFAAHNPNGQIRRQSSAGGVFTMLAQEIIRQGGVVYGAAFDDEWHVAHKRVETENGLAELRGSKYAFSSVGEAYTQAQADLDAGRKVLFSGTPCQVAAMRKRVGDNPLLLLVEVVCHGAPDPIYWEKYLKEYLDAKGKKYRDIESINFRDKRNGWKHYNLTIRYTDGSEDSEFHGANLYMRGFLKNFTLRQACFKCPFKYPDGSKADITLGDFWGIEKIEDVCEEDSLSGISLVIGKTNKGENAIKNIQGREYEESDIYKLNHALTQKAKFPAKFNEFREKAEHTDNFIGLIDKYTREPLSIRIKVAISKMLKSLRLHNR